MAAGRARRFFDLVPTDDPLQWRVPAEQRVCVGPPDNVFMFGGVALGGALSALETALGRPVICASSQFLSPIRPNEVLELELATRLSGKNVSQASVVGRVSGREVFSVHAAVGARESDVCVAN